MYNALTHAGHIRRACITIGGQGIIEFATLISGLDRHRGKVLCGLFLAAVLLRVIYVFAIVGDDGFPYGVEYFPYAENLAAGHGYYQFLHLESGSFLLLSRRPPLYPVFLAFLNILFGSSYKLAARWAQVLLCSACVWPVYLLGKESYSRGAGLLAALLFVIYPGAIYYCIQLNPVIVTMAINGLLLVFLVRLGKHRRFLDAGLAGAFLGASILSRAHLLFFLLPIILYLFICTRSWRKTLTLGLFAGLTMAAVLAPWTVRNYAIHGVVMPSSSFFWREFLVANNPANINNPLGFTMETGEQYYHLGEIEGDRAMRDKALAFVRAHPGEYLRLCLDRFIRLWRLYPHAEFVQLKYVLAMLFSYGLLIPFCLYGIKSSLAGHWRIHFIFYLLIAYFSAIAAAVVSYTRYRMFFLPVILLFGAIGIIKARERWGGTIIRQWSQHTPAARAADLIGTALIAYGVLANQWLLGMLLTADGTISAGPFLFIIISAQAAALCLGALLLWQRRNPQIFGNLALLVGAATVTLVAAEFILGATEEKLSILRDNPNGTGSYRLQSNLDLVTRIGGRATVIRTNSHGMHSPETTIAKPDGIRRIAFCGNSFTFGCWADSYRESFVGVFADRIDTSSYEVLNFGVPGYGMPDIALQIDEDVLRFSPDYIVIVFFNGNDFRDSFFGMNKYIIENGVAVWNEAECNRKLPPEFRPVSGLQQFVANRAIFRFLSRVMLLSPAGGATPEQPAAFPVDSHNFSNATFWSQAEYPPVAAAARDITLASLAEIKERCDAAGVTLLLVTLPFAEQVYAIDERGPGYDINHPQQFVADYCRANGIGYYDLLPPLRQLATSDTAPLFCLPYDSHFNNRGHRLAGDSITSFFSSTVTGARAQ